MSGQQRNLTRRDLLKGTGLLLSAPLLPSLGAAGDPPQPQSLAGLRGLNHLPSALQENFVRQFRAAKKAADARRAALRTKADGLAYIEEVRRKLSRGFGPLPERTPLNARVTGVVQRDGYTIEKIIFESRPGFLVTANLYLPRGGGRRPGVVGACGHWAEGKAFSQYQAFSQGLARQGYVVLVYDPIGQGERLQYLDGGLRPRFGPGGVHEHLQAGNQQVLVGEFFGAWRLWDGIRALDYLAGRPEVDPSRIGVTGNSGGGTDTVWLSALDPRWAMTAPATFVTTFLHNIENELPGDSEQCPPLVVAEGLDECDFLAAYAPRPVILMGVERDFFDIRGLEEAYAQLRRLYALWGKEDDVRLVIDDDYHNYTKRHREALYGFFNEKSGLGRPAPEPELRMEKESDLWCTPQGQVAAQDSRTVYSFTAEKSRTLREGRRSLSPTELKTSLRELLRVVEPKAAPDYRILPQEGLAGYPKKHAGRYALEIDGGPLCVVYRLSDDPVFSRPPRAKGRALLYVAHESSDLELRESPFLRGLCREAEETAIFACDLRGVGESRPNTCGSHRDSDHGADYMYASNSLMLGRPYLGQKTSDLLAVLRWLESFGYREVHVAADGYGSLPATFAGVLDERVVQVTLRRSLDGYGEVAETPYYNWPLSALLPHVLAHFDLADCYRALGAKGLKRIESWGAIRT